MKASPLASLIVIAALVSATACTPNKTEAVPPADASAPAAPAATPPVTEPAPAPAATPASPTAASPGKPSAPVRIELLAHADSVVGTPAELVVTITPTTTLERVSGEISAGDGVQMTPVSFDLAAPAAGKAAPQSVQVTRSGAGAGYVKVLVQAWQGGVAQTKVVLLAVRGGDPVAPKATAPVQTVPGGERIISLPVEETTK